jgi:hypothetical protein
MTVLLDKERKMDNAQKNNICTNVQSPQTFKSYVDICFEVSYITNTGDVNPMVQYK